MVSLASNTKPELPVLSYLPGLNLLNPAWKSCSVDADDLGMIDPPRTLDKATAMAPSSTPSAAPVPSAVPDQASATPAPSLKTQITQNNPPQSASILRPDQSAASDSAPHASSIDAPSKDPASLNSDPLSQTPRANPSSNQGTGSSTGSFSTEDVASNIPSDYIIPQGNPEPSDTGAVKSDSESKSQSASTIPSQQLPASAAIKATSQAPDPMLGGIIASALGHAPDAAVDPPRSSIQSAGSGSERLLPLAGTPSPTSINQALPIIPTQIFFGGSIIKAGGTEVTPVESPVGLQSSEGLVFGATSFPTSTTASLGLLEPQASASHHRQPSHNNDRKPSF